jgi:sporulation protein YlmC with PRC-barrel domain
MLIEDGKLRDKKVITADGRQIGEVVNLEIELEGWKVQWLGVKLAREVLDGLKVKKPLFGTVTVRFAPERIRNVTDNVVLTIDFEEVGAALAADGAPDGVEKKK